MTLVFSLFTLAMLTGTGFFLYRQMVTMALLLIFAAMFNFWCLLLSLQNY